MPISSPGLGSGIDVKSIVSQLVALERAPLAPLQKQASAYQSKLSVYGTIRSLVSSLGDAGAKLALPATFQAVKATSSQPDAVGITVAQGTAPTALSLKVLGLAKAQSTASAAVTQGSGMGAGTLTISLGDWSTGSFVAGSAAPVNIEVEAGKDTMTEIAAKINAANAGVTATVLRDASGERLLMRSKSTGEAMGYQVGVVDADANDGKNLARLAWQTGVTTGTTLTQAGENARAEVNGVLIKSGSNTVRDALPGITLELKQVTTTAADLSVSDDKDSMRKSVQAFVDAYNAINDMLATSTKYDPDTKVAGSLQGDSTAVGLRNALRSMMRSETPGGSFSRLLDVGVGFSADGKMTVDSAKLGTALDNPAEMARLFGTTNESPTLRGFGLKLKAFADGLVNSGGTVSNRTDALRNAVTRTNKEMDKVVERASRAEQRYLTQYNAMDANVARLNSLNAYVAQQITLWNKNGAN